MSYLSTTVQITSATRGSDELDAPAPSRDGPLDTLTWSYLDDLHVSAGGSSWTIPAGTLATFATGGGTTLDLTKHAYLVYGLPDDKQLYVVAQENANDVVAVQDIAPLVWVQAHQDLVPMGILLVPQTPFKVAGVAYTSPVVHAGESGNNEAITNGPTVRGDYFTDPEYKGHPEPDPFHGLDLVPSYTGAHNFGVSSDRLAGLATGVVYVIGDGGDLYRYSTPDGKDPAGNKPVVTFPLPHDPHAKPEDPKTCETALLKTCNLTRTIGVASDGTIIWVLLEAVNIDGITIIDLARGVIRSDDGGGHWVVQRTIDSGVGDAQGIAPAYGDFGMPTVEGLFTSNGEVGKFRTRGYYRFSDATHAKWDTEIDMPPYSGTLWVQTDGTILIGTGSFPVVTFDWAMPPVPENGVDGGDPFVHDGPLFIYFTGGSSTDLEVAAFYDIPAYHYHSSTPSFSIIVNLSISNNPPNLPLATEWIDAGDGTELFRHTSNVTGSFVVGTWTYTFTPVLTLTYEPKLPLPALAPMGLGIGGVTLVGSPYATEAPLGFTYAGTLVEHKPPYDPPRWHDSVLSPSDADVLERHMALDKRQLYYQYDGYYVGWNVNGFLLCRFGGPGPAGEMPPFTSGTHPDAVNSDGSAVIVDNTGVVDARIPASNACDDGNGGLYAIRRDTGDLVHRSGDITHLWEVIVPNVTPVGAGVPVLAWSRRQSGMLCCIHGSAGGGTLTYIDPVNMYKIDDSTFKANFRDEVIDGGGTGGETITDYTYAASEL